ncbi:MAG: hypothetical protein ABSA57_20770 [Candidatus Acidiferrales bacterium]|jgi:hypothetical protein
MKSYLVKTTYLDGEHEHQYRGIIRADEDISDDDLEKLAKSRAAKWCGFGDEIPFMRHKEDFYFLKRTMTRQVTEEEVETLLFALDEWDDTETDWEVELDEHFAMQEG